MIGASVDELSGKEREVLVRLARGERIKDISLAMGLSPNTTSTYRARLMKKLTLRSNAELVRYVMKQEGWRKEVF